MSKLTLAALVVAMCAGPAFADEAPHDEAPLQLSEVIESVDRQFPLIRAAVAEQRALNDELQSRNASLDAEVVNLKVGRDAAEERARTDLGMIGKFETFYQVVPVGDAAR